MSPEFAWDGSAACTGQNPRRKRRFEADMADKVLESAHDLRKRVKAKLQAALVMVVLQ
jgi:hypothetical protein